MAEETALKDKVQDLLDTTINPAVAGHGGYVELIDVKDTTRLHPDGGRLPGLRRGRRHAQGRHRAADHRGRVPEVAEVLDTTDHASGSNPYYTAGKALSAPAAARSGGGSAPAAPDPDDDLPHRGLRRRGRRSSASTSSCASERPSTFEAALPDNLLTLDFADPGKAPRTVARVRRAGSRSTRWCRSTTAPRSSARPSPSGSASGRARVAAVEAARNKHRMREALRRGPASGRPRLPAAPRSATTRRPPRGARRLSVRAQADDPRRPAAA